MRVGMSSRADPSLLCRERASIVRLRVMTNLRLRAGGGASLSFRKKEGSKEKSRVVWRFKHVASLVKNVDHCNRRHRKGWLMTVTCFRECFRLHYSPCDWQFFV